MIEFIVLAFVFVFGACLGSFVVASVWRQRARQLAEDKKARRKFDKAEYARLKPLMGRKASKDRSQCLGCGCQLRARDLVPVASWLCLRGKCRECHAKIGWTEFLAEIGLGAAFVVSFAVLAPYYTWLSVVYLLVWLVFITILAFLFVYDFKWSLMPTGPLYAAVATAIVLFALGAFKHALDGPQLVSLGLSMVFLPGLYWLLHKISRGQWVGDGDWLLALAVALVLQDYLFSLLALFVSNVIGCMVFAANRALGPKSLTTNSRLPYGPMLIAGFFIVWALRVQIMQWIYFY
jgi:leader peptidase (prepilin peptidase)/N-methyltransferase